ncbi:MAG: glycosyltransferase family 4 protein [Bacteroidota bacterium]|nr:glycosyltransferase family 4 protein [Bacteroidota bacterium]
MDVNICHLTSVHPRNDTRIYHKELMSLKAAGNQVTLIVADGKGNETTSDGIDILDVGKASGRLSRILKTRKKVFILALNQNAQVYHFHDPELLPYGVRLAGKGYKVIYDAHEDLPRQILSKYWINKPLRKLLSVLSEKFENYYSKRVSHIITATDFIRDRYKKINPNVSTVKNYPVHKDSLIEIDESVSKVNEISYIGAIAQVRGITELVKSLALCKNDIRLNLAGNFSPPEYKEELSQFDGWEKVNVIGFADREKVRELLERSFAGVVTLHPIINYRDALPVKLFEYMAAGIPVVSSDIPLWKQIVDDAECGICVNPLDPSELATAIDFLYENPEKVKTMGEKGQQAAIKKYSWEQEEKYLLDAYEKTIN